MNYEDIKEFLNSNQRALHVARKAFYVVIVTLLVILALLVVMSAFGIPSRLKLFVVQSGSMEPAIRTGSIVLVQAKDSYEEGHVITFTREEDGDIPVTHRIVEILYNEGGTSFVTKGDANDAPDIYPVDPENIIGRTVFSVPLIGYPVAFAKTQFGFLFLIVIPATIIAYSEILVLKKEITNKITERKNNKQANELAKKSESQLKINEDKPGKMQHEQKENRGETTKEKTNPNNK